MAKDPAFLFYPADFLVGTMDMSDEEVGIYIRLLCRQHQKGNINPKVMDGLSEEILSKFRKDNQGNYYNKRLKTEMDKRQKFVESRRANGSKGGRPKKDKDNQEETDSKPLGKPTKNLTENENENENKNKDLNEIERMNKEYRERLKRNPNVNQEFLAALGVGK
jgi:uncharacterized protein YdaU (DUF1376 family)